MSDLICPLSGKIFQYPVIAHDGYVYEKEFIENLFNSSIEEYIISPTTNELMKKGYILFSSLNIVLDKFHTDFESDPESDSKTILTKYSQESIIIIQNYFDKLMNDANSSIDDIISYISEYNDIDLMIDATDSEYNVKFLEFINNEKCLELFLSEHIKYIDFDESKSYKICDIIKYSDICILAYKYIINDYHESYFYDCCYNGRYELAIKLYEFDNNAINYINTKNNIDNVFNACITSGNIDLIKFVHEKNPLLCKNISSFKMSSLEQSSYSLRFEVIKYLFTIDKNVFNDEPNKNNVLKHIKNSPNTVQYANILALIVENI